MINTVLLQHERDPFRQVAARERSALEAGPVGILGAGMMGAGIAHANASRGIAWCSRT